MSLDPAARNPDVAEAASNAVASREHHRLANLVGAAFPAMALGDYRVDQTGGDHVLLIVDDHYAFRFPRAGMHDLRLEMEVLKRLQRRSSLPTPRYDRVDPAGRFAGYEYLPGSPLTPGRFAVLPQSWQTEILGTAASFLAELHAICPSDVTALDDWPAMWTAAEFADCAIAAGLPLIEQHLPKWVAPIAAFYARYRQQHVDSLVVVHGDLVAEHLLLDEHSGQLAGIIDFGDVALGDPAQDFLGFWAYGEGVAAQAVALYPPTAADPSLLERSRNHFIRYRLDRVFENLGRRGDLDLAQAEAEIDAVLRSSNSVDPSGRR